MKQICNVIFALCALLGVVFFSACEKKIDESIISKGSDFSEQARIKAQNLDKESYKDLADLFLDTSEIDFSRDVLIIFGKNQCTYCDMLKADIKKNPALKAKIKENFNPYYINTSYDKTHKIRGFNAESSLDSATRAENVKSSENSTANSSIVDEKSGLRSHEREDRTNSSSTKQVASLPDLSPQDEFATANLAKIFGINLTPQVVFLDKNGKVKYLFAGYLPNFEKITDEVLASSAPLGNYASVDKNLERLIKREVK